MRRFGVCVAAVLAASAWLPFAATGQVASGQAAKDQVATEIERLAEATAAKARVNKDWEENKTEVTGPLDEARRALDSGSLYLAIEKLFSAYATHGVTESMFDHPDVTAKGMPGFEAFWSQADAELKADEAKYETARAARTSPLPLAVAGMAEASSLKWRAYYASSRVYSEALAERKDNEANAVRNGLNLLGASRGVLQFAIFCESLNFGEAAKEPAATPKLHSLAPELNALEARMINAYQPPRSIEKHPEFIRMHSTLKEARDLDAARLYAGALFKYLSALELFATFEAPASAKAASAGDFEKQIQQASAWISDGADRSLIELLDQHLKADEKNIARAGANDASPAQAQPTLGAEQQALVAEVIPAYRAAMERGGEPAETAKTAITVTLVRWPYT